MSGTAETVLVDSGFWIALLDPTDEHHAEARSKKIHLDKVQVVCPWPTLYEVVCTQLVKNPVAVSRYEQLLNGTNIELFSDVPYREKALKQVFRAATKRPMALVDIILRLIIEDARVRIDGLLTFNRKDFVDVCYHGKKAVRIP